MTQSLHAWVHPIRVAFVPGQLSPVTQLITDRLLAWLKTNGSTVDAQPARDTDLVITTACMGDVISRDASLFFNAKRWYRLARRPQVLTIVDVPESDYEHWLTHFEALARLPESAVAEQQYPGLGAQAAQVIAHQARRGGPDLAFCRLLQAQVLSIRVMAVHTVDGRPVRAMHYDLAGARPVSDATDLEAFAHEVGPRLLAATCAEEANRHIFDDDPIPAEHWAALRTPDDMIRAGEAFTRFGFFTEPILVERLLGFGGISEVISAQFSEGCYAVYEPEVGGLITTASGSSRLVDKRAISRADQAVVVGVRPEGDGAVVRPVAGRERVAPSVEAVEMFSLCRAAGEHMRRGRPGTPESVPNIRAILHGHLGVAAYDPARVEAVSLEPTYYTQLVSCGTVPLAQATAAAFGRSTALRDLDDPRRVAFLEQPGHGVVVVEKWPPAGQDEPAFSAIQQCLEDGALQVALAIPQGRVCWAPASDAADTRRLKKVAC